MICNKIETKTIVKGVFCEKRFTVTIIIIYSNLKMKSNTRKGTRENTILSLYIITWSYAQSTKSRGPENKEKAWTTSTNKTAYIHGFHQYPEDT